MKNYIRISVIFFSVVMMVLAGPARAQVTIETIALSGWQAPDADLGVVFGGSGISPGNFFGEPRINSSGQIIFKASLTGTGIDSSNDLGVFTGTSSTLSMVARQGDHAPDTDLGVVFSSSSNFAGNSIINTGQFSLASSLTGPGVGSSNNYGLWTGTSAVDMSLLVREGDQAPDMASGVTYSGFYPTEIRGNNAGQIAFRSDVTGPGIVSGRNSTGIWTGNSSADLSLFIRTGQTPPGRTDLLTIIPEGGMDFWLNDNGKFVMRTLLTENGYEGAATVGTGAIVITGTSSDDWEVVAVSGQRAPGTLDDVVFKNHSAAGGPASINNTGQMTFRFKLEGPGVDSTNDEGIWTGTNVNDLTLFVREGDQVPGMESGVIFSTVGTSTISENGNIWFGSSLSGPGLDSTNNGYSWMGPDVNNLTMIVREGDSLPGLDAGETGKGGGGGAINDAGQMVFKSKFGSSTGHGIWAYDPDSGLQLVAKSGDVIEVAPGDFRTIREDLWWTWYADPSGNQEGVSDSFNNAGQLAFKAMFTDGSDGIFLATIPSLVPGDFDGDGDVDGVDFGLWQSGYPTASGASLGDGDADGDGDVDGVDFGLWQANYPTNLGGAAMATVPEPATLFVMLAPGLVILLRNRRSRFAAIAKG